MERPPENKIAQGFLYIVIIRPGDCEWNSNHFQQAEVRLDHLRCSCADLQGQPGGGNDQKLD